MAQLDQAAAVLVAGHVAAHELERDRPAHRMLGARLREGARDALVAQVEDRRQLRRPAHTTSVRVRRLVGENLICAPELNPTPLRWRRVTLPR